MIDVPRAQVFNASHMVPYDVPDVAHDMILRFMGVDFSAILEGSARIPSSVGDDVKPIFMDDENPVSSKPPGTTPAQTKAQWDGERHLFYVMVVRFGNDVRSILQYRDGRAGLFTRRHRTRRLFMVSTPQKTRPALSKC